MVWERRGSRYLFESPWFNVRQDQVVLPDGREIPYTSVEHPGYAMAVPVLDDGRIVMVRVYRHTLGRSLLECPAGGLDGESARTAAGRELEEETGYRAGALEPLGTFFGSSGISDEVAHLFLATRLEHAGATAHEVTEQIEVELHPLRSLAERALRGEIEDAPSALAILLAQARLGTGGRA